MCMLNKLLCAGNRYLKEMDLADMAALKFCLASMGVLMGLGVSARHKKPVGLLAAILFVGTYIPLMSKFIAVGWGEENGCLDIGEACATPPQEE